MAIEINKMGSTAVVRVTAASSANAVTEAHNLSDFALTTSSNVTENVVALTITSVYFSGNGTVTRGANVVLNLIDSDNWQLEGDAAIVNGAAANLSITTNGTIILKVRKHFGAPPGEPEYFANN